MAIGGGGLGGSPENAALDAYLLGLTAKDKPRVCYIPTANGDSAVSIVNFYSAYNADRAVASHLALFMRTIRDVRSFLLSQDMIFVGGGNTAAMLAIWRQHGVDEVLREAWQQRINIYAGNDKGRIYRVYRKERSAVSSQRSAVRFDVPNFARMSDVELVAELRSSNGWRRDTAQMLLVQRDEISADALRLLGAEALRSGAPGLSRVHALCTLDGRGARFVVRFAA